MEIQQRRWFKRNGRTHKTPRLYEQRAETSNEPIPNAKIGRTLASAVQDKELVFHQDGLGDDGTYTTGPRNSK
jgi:hypothetical protein